MPVPVQNRYEYLVRGRCDDEFDALSFARRFLKREFQKFRNGRLRPFVATHTIYYRPAELGSVRRRIPVWVIDGACFQQKEWVPCTRAEFFWDVRNDILMHGNIILNWRWSIRPVVAPEPSSTALMSIEEIARLDRERPGAEFLPSAAI